MKTILTSMRVLKLTLRQKEYVFISKYVIYSLIASYSRGFTPKRCQTVTSPN